jgi:hypothetical protein
VLKYLSVGLLAAFLPACAVADSPRTVYGIGTVAGSASMGDGGPAIDAQLGTLNGAAVEICISHTGRNWVRKADSAAIITTGAGVAGFSGDGGPATSSISAEITSRGL